MKKFVTCNLFLAPSLSSWTAPVSFGQEQSTVRLIKAGGLGGLQGRLRPFAVDFDRNQLSRVAEDRGIWPAYHRSGREDRLPLPAKHRLFLAVSPGESKAMQRSGPRK
jgi:hypothetical protein